MKIADSALQWWLRKYWKNLRKEQNKNNFEKFENDKKRVINTNWTSLKRSNPIKMTIFNLYIFDEKGSIIYYKEWLRKKHTSMEKDEVRSAGFGKWVFNVFACISSLKNQWRAFNYLTFLNWSWLRCFPLRPSIWHT